MTLSGSTNSTASAQVSGNRDLPFYDGWPIAPDAGQWRVLLGSCLLGYLLLYVFGSVFAGPVSQFIPALLFVSLPVGALLWLGRGCLGAVFRPVSLREAMLMPAFALLYLFIAVIVALIVASFFDVSVNPAAVMIRQFSPVQFSVFLLRTLPQLVAEELISILPFLAVLTYCVNKLGFTRRQGIAVALLLTALLFGVLHLPTYEWNVAQSLLIIGTARVVLTTAYLATGNLWVSSGAHIIGDWCIFFVAYFGPELPLE